MIRPGDIVRLQGDVPLHAVVLLTAASARGVDRSVKRGHLLVASLCRQQAPIDVRTRDVVAHWRKTKTTTRTS